MDRDQGRHVNTPSGIPTTPHWALIEASSVYEEGWDRGDGGRSVPIITYRVYTDEAAFTKDFAQAVRQGNVCRGMWISHTYTTETTVTILKAK